MGVANHPFWRAVWLPLWCAALLVPAIFAAEADPEAQGAAYGRFGPGAGGAYIARNGMVATSCPYATMAGLETLRAGGNAIDAVAVVQFVLTFTEPYASGIGGGLFCMYYNAETGGVVYLDGREEAPRAFSSDAFLDAEGRPLPFPVRASCGNAVGVPGTPAAIARLLKEHGTLSLEEAVAPAARIARHGMVVTQPFEQNLDRNWERIQRHPATAALFAREDGTPLRAGDLFRNPKLADTLELIGRDGVGAFYTGPIAEDIVKAVRGDPNGAGVMTPEDLSNYRAVYREPVSVDYRGYQVVGANMPSSGGASLGLMLGILEAKDFASAPNGSPDAVELLANAQNLAFADRNQYMADADFVNVPVAGLLDPDYARRRAGLIAAGRAVPVPVAPGAPDGAGGRENANDQEATKGPSTTHFTIVDRHGNVASVTSTIEQHFGSGLLAPGRGFLLNNELTDFDAVPRDAQGHLVANAPEGGWKPRRTALGTDADTEGGKRPRSSMTPTIVLKDGKPFLALGSPGGSRIIGTVLNALVNVLDHGMDVQQAVNAPRVIARNGPVELEAPLYRDQALRKELEARGFEVSDVGSTGSVQAVLIGEDGWLRGAADPRRAGLVVGY